MSTDFIVTFLLSTHMCLFFDMSPLQKRPACKLNFFIASFISVVPPMAFSYFSAIPSPVKHFSILAGITLLSSIIAIVNIQKLLDYEVDF